MIITTISNRGDVFTGLPYQNPLMWDYETHNQNRDANTGTKPTIYKGRPWVHEEVLQDLRETFKPDEARQVLNQQRFHCGVLEKEVINQERAYMAIFGGAALMGGIGVFVAFSDKNNQPSHNITTTVLMTVATALTVLGSKVLSISRQNRLKYDECMEKYAELERAFKESHRYDPSSDDGAVIDVEPERPAIPVDQRLPARFASDVVELKTALADTTQASLLNPTLPILGQHDFDATTAASIHPGWYHHDVINNFTPIDDGAVAFFVSRDDENNMPDYQPAPQRNRRDDAADLFFKTVVVGGLLVRSAFQIAASLAAGPESATAGFVLPTVSEDTHRQNDSL